MDTI